MKQFWWQQLKEIIDYQFKLNWYDKIFEDIGTTPIIDWKRWNETFYTTPEKNQQFQSWLIKFLSPYMGKQLVKSKMPDLLKSFWFTIKK